MNSSDNSKIRVLRDKKAVAEFAVNTWIELATASVAEKRVFTAALSGGRTPIDFYQRLASCPYSLPWDRIHIFFADERFVPPDDNLSNYRMINEQLLSHIPIPKKNIHPMMTEGVSLEESAKQYEADMRTFFKIGENDLPVFDLIMLGLGEDGHTASLFPATTALQETKRLVIPVIADASPSERVSLSLGVINNAKNICFLVTGANKAEAIKTILEDKASTLPAAQVKPTQGILLFLLNKTAASLLSNKES
jgi:6-phosphogluconolactonase